MMGWVGGELKGNKRQLLLLAKTQAMSSLAFKTAFVALQLKRGRSIRSTTKRRESADCARHIAFILTSQREAVCIALWTRK